MADRRDETRQEEPHDPEESEMEIDAANDKSGGPNSRSLSGGLSSTLQPGGTAPGGGPGTGEGSLGTGGGQTAGKPTGNVKKSPAR